MDRAIARREFVVRAGAAALAGSLAAALGGCGGCEGDETEEKGSEAPPSTADAPPREDARPRPPSSEPIVRVRLRTVREARERVRVGSESRWIEVVRNGATQGGGGALDGGALDGPQVLHAPITVGRSGSGWSILDARGYRAAADAGDRLALRASAPADGFTLDGAPYSGSLEVVPRPDVGARAFDIVNHVRVEAYLPGVLSGELYPDWHIETHAAQAIAARSFACAERELVAAGRHFDLHATARSLVYQGELSTPRAREAVAMTAGTVLVWRERLVSGYYSSCCGGAAASAADAIGPNPANDIAPLAGRTGEDVCTGAPVYSWSARRPLHEVVARLAAFGRERGRADLAALVSLVSIDVRDRNANDRPRTFVIVPAKGTSIEIGAESLRRAIDQDAAGLPAVKEPLRSSFAAFAIDGNTLAITGRGFGHGAGLCQYGAEALARSGKDHREIVAWYYPEVEIVRAYEERAVG